MRSAWEESYIEGVLFYKIDSAESNGLRHKTEPVFREEITVNEFKKISSHVSASCRQHKVL